MIPMNYPPTAKLMSGLLLPLCKIISLGTNDYRSGDEIRPILIGSIDETSKILDI